MNQNEQQQEYARNAHQKFPANRRKYKLTHSPSFLLFRNENVPATKLIERHSKTKFQLAGILFRMILI